MSETKKLWLRFKSGSKLGWQYIDQTGFVWLHGHEREHDEQYARFLAANFPNNFTVFEPEIPSVAKTPTKPVKAKTTKTK